MWHRWSPPAEPSREAVALATLWRIATRDRFVAAGAEVLLELGGSAVFALAPEQLVRAVELCLRATHDPDQEEAGSGSVSCGITLGPIERSPSTTTYIGDAIDRAQALANAAGPGELLLDAAAQAATGSVFLFAREVSFGLGLTAAALDRAFPRRRECQRALAHLARPRFPASGQAQLESLRRLIRSSGRHRVLLVGPHGIGISDWIARVAEEVAPSVWLDIRAPGASLAPLSGLMYALRRLPSEATPEQLLTRGGQVEQDALGTLIAVRAGAAVSRRDAVLALRHYIGRAAESGQRAWITVDPAPLVDPSTVGVVAEAAREGGPDVLVMMRLLLESKPPEAFARGGGLSEVRVRGLSPHEARALAASMLKCDLPSDVARRAAAMGGDNPLAVAEAVRVLVASGDVIFADHGFRWRRGPAGRPNTISLEALIEERIDALEPPLKHALEVLATMPDPDDRELGAEIAAEDGLPHEAWTRALEGLESAGLIRFDPRSVCLSSSVRLVVQGTIAPVRALELNCAVVVALARRVGEEHAFARANLAYYLARAGQVADAAAIFIEVAAIAGQLGFLRSGVRLAAAAVECDPSKATRARAAQIAERLSLRANGAALSAQAARAQPREPSGNGEPPVNGSPRPASVPPAARGIASEARVRAVQAILARDFDEVERAFELLVAAGRDGASVDRLRTITLLVKGDLMGALALLARMREGSEAEPVAPRESPQLTLTSALVAIAAGELEPAVRSCLEALARTREAQDALGERAALSVLSMCYRRLGREADATRLAHAALEQHAASS